MDEDESSPSPSPSPSPSSRSPSPELLKEVDELLAVLEEPDVSADHRQQVVHRFYQLCQQQGRPEAFLPALQMHFMAPLVAQGSTVLILLCADRTRYYWVVEKVQDYGERFMQLQNLLAKLKGILARRQGSQGDLSHFVDLLDECLNSEGERIMTAPKFQELVEDGPAAYHIPPKLLQQLLAVALHRPRNIQLSYNGLPDLRTFSLFMAPPTVATAQDATAYIKPFTRQVLLSLGAVQYAFSKHQSTEYAKGQRLLNVVQKAVLRVGSYYRFMPDHLRTAVYANQVVTTVYTLTPFEYTTELMKSILTGEMQQRLPASTDRHGQDQLLGEVGAALSNWTNSSAAHAIQQIRAETEAAAAAAGTASTAGTAATSAAPAALALPGAALGLPMLSSGGYAAAALSRHGSSAAAATAGSGAPQLHHQVAGSFSSSGSMGQGQVSVPNMLLPAPLVDMEEATRVAAQQVIALMQQQEEQQQELDTRTATARVMQGLLHLALAPQNVQGGGGQAAAQGGPGAEEEAPGADPMEVEEGV